MKKYSYIFVGLIMLMGMFGVYNYAKADIYGSSLVGWWTLDSNDISGTTVTDKSGTGNTGTSAGSPTATNGILGQALTFNGTTGAIDLGANSSLVAGTSNFTYTGWVYKLTAINSFMIASRTSSASAGYDLLIGGGSVPGTANCRINDNTSHVFTGTLMSFSQTGWVFFACVINKTGNLLNSYVNGNLNSSDDITTISGSITNSQNPMIAKRASTFLIGTIDDVRIYSRALSTPEVKTLYYQGMSQHSNGDF